LAKLAAKLIFSYCGADCRFDMVLVKMNRPEDFPNGADVWSEPLKWIGDTSLICPNKLIPLVLSPQPCVYRNATINALDEAGRS